MMRRCQKRHQREKRGRNGVGAGNRRDQSAKGPSFKKIKVVTDENRLMHFGPYRMNTYGAALRSNPEYVKYMIKENKRDNQKARFTHWAMAYIMETFFAEDKEEEAEVVEEDHQMPKVGGRPRYRRMTSAERSSKRGRWIAGY